MNENNLPQLEVTVGIGKKGGYVPVKPLDLTRPPRGQPQPASQTTTQPASGNGSQSQPLPTQQTNP